MITKKLSVVRPASILALLLVVGGLLLTGCGTQEEEAADAQSESAREVVLGEADVTAAQSITLDAGLPVNGTLEPFKVADVKAQAAGTLIGVTADQGTQVSAGQTLARIRAEGLGSQVINAQSGVEAAESQLALATKQLESMRNLYEAGAVSRLEVDNAQARVDQARTQVRSAKAQVTAASEQAGNRTVSSPITGKVSVRSVNDGEAVNPGQRLFTVVNTSMLELAGTVPSERIQEVHVGQDVRMTIGQDTGRMVMGTVNRIDPVANPATRQVTVWIRVNNQNEKLVGGQFVSGTILSGESKTAVVVPAAAVREDGGRRYVVVVSNGSFETREVTLGIHDEQRNLYEVLSGVAPNEYVVTAPVSSIDTNVRVRIGSEKKSATASDAAKASGEGSRS